MEDIMLTRALRAQGYDPEELARLLRQGELTRIRRGAYTRTVTDGEVSVDARHRRLVLATLPQLSAAAVVSHGSAALLHGLPTWPEATTHVHVTRDRGPALADEPSWRSTAHHSTQLTSRWSTG